MGNVLQLAKRNKMIIYASSKPLLDSRDIPVRIRTNLGYTKSKLSIQDFTKDWLKTNGYTSRTVNRGPCEKYAKDFIKVFGGSLWSTQGHYLGGHSFVEYKGAFYDGATPNGVENFWDLTYFKPYARKWDIPNSYKGIKSSRFFKDTK